MGYRTFPPSDHRRGLAAQRDSSPAAAPGPSSEETIARIKLALAALEDALEGFIERERAWMRISDRLAAELEVERLDNDLLRAALRQKEE